MVDIDIREGLSLFDDAFSIHRQIPEFQIDSTTYEQLTKRIENVTRPLVLVAYIDNQPAGYLMGYERFSSFYIWLAGVLISHRNQGVFTALMNQIEQWALRENYTSLTIKTRNRFKSMILYLVSNDFKFINIDRRDSIETHRILLEKQLKYTEK